MDINLANRIARECLAQFAKLPKTGKPNESFEWTILSAIVLVTPAHHAASSDIRVVALGTGTKCLPGDELSPRGDRVHDSHAEVLARRAFVRYLYEQIEQALLVEGGQPKESIFERQTVDGGGCGKFVLKNGHSFHFFTTHSPCGDASIYKREEDALLPAKRARRTDEACSDRADEETTVGCCIGEDRTAVGMTGGKLLDPEAHGDLMAQTIGAVRTKPGRGVRTASVSCSDKLARWNVLGVQGGLLMMLLGRPIYLDGVVVCDGTDHSVVALERAIWGRFERWKEPALREPFERHHRPVVIAADGGELFAYRKNRPHPTKEAGGKFQPSPCGIVWCDVKERPHEVEVAGRRHGVTKRKLATPAARLQISKIELFNRFARTYRRAEREALHNLTVPSSVEGATQPNIAAADDVGKLSYADAKARSVAYATQWASVRATMFGRWPVKPTSLGAFLSDAS
uniref:tRNA-specific adenosine deaminase 1 n=4 Tax=gambiae species complex TaxID=44542 RepID=A0A1S4H143_ANOGA|nr:tRNA-specific adenosine deaminase 1 [Anopheles coluzzii]